MIAFFYSLFLWWQQDGKVDYPNAQTLLILCDGGGSNSCRHYVFKQAIQKLANHIQLTIRVAHYPTTVPKKLPKVVHF